MRWRDPDLRSNPFTFGGSTDGVSHSLPADFTPSLHPTSLRHRPGRQVVVVYGSTVVTPPRLGYRKYRPLLPVGRSSDRRPSRPGSSSRPRRDRVCPGKDGRNLGVTGHRGGRLSGRFTRVRTVELRDDVLTGWSCCRGKRSTPLTPGRPSVDSLEDDDEGPRPVWSFLVSGSRRHPEPSSNEQGRKALEIRSARVSGRTPVPGLTRCSQGGESTLLSRRRCRPGSRSRQGCQYPVAHQPSRSGVRSPTPVRPYRGFQSDTQAFVR